MKWLPNLPLIPPNILTLSFHFPHRGTLILLRVKFWLFHCYATILQNLPIVLRIKSRITKKKNVQGSSGLSSLIPWHLTTFVFLTLFVQNIQKYNSLTKLQQNLRVCFSHCVKHLFPLFRDQRKCHFFSMPPLSPQIMLDHPMIFSLHFLIFFATCFNIAIK